MRKISLMILLSIITFSFVTAQETEDKTVGTMVSKRGINILPEAGEIGLGVDALPFVQFFGNTFNGNVFNTGSFDFVNGSNNAIIGKYMLTESSAIRARLRIGKGTSKDVEYIMKDTLPVPDPLFVTEDVFSSSYSNIQLGVGYEMSRGKGRVQGFYGGEVMLQLTSVSEEYEYGNSYSPEFTNPNTTNFFTGNITGTGRLLETNGMNTVAFGARGFIGIEYFFTPKISIGGEFGWAIGMAKTKDYTQVEEQWDGLQIQEVETKAAGGSSWALDTDNSGGGIFLTFYF